MTLSALFAGTRSPSGTELRGAEVPPLSGLVSHPFDPGPFAPPGEAIVALPGPAVLMNVSTAVGGTAQNEPCIAVDPSDCFQMAACWNDYFLGDARAGLGATMDGGASWFSGLLIEPTHQVQGNTSIAADRNGNFYLSMLSFNRDPTTGLAAAGIGSGIYLSVWAGGFTLWTPPLLVGPDGPDAFVDKPLLAVDGTGGSFDGTVHLAWTRFLDQNGIPSTFELSQIWFARYVPGWLAPGAPVLLSDAGTPSGQGACPAVGQGGVVLVAWKAGTTIYLDRSYNGGASFGLDSPIFAINPLPPTINPAIRVNSFPTLVADTGGGPFNGRLYCVWADYANGDADILCRRSVNGGLAWSPPVRVNDDPVANGTDQFLPWASVGRDGTLHVTFLDRRDDPGNLNFRAYASQSTDGGVSFGPNVPLAAFSSSPATNFNGTYLGDYIGVAATGVGAFPAWVGTGFGSQDILGTGTPGPARIWPSVPSISAASGGSVNLQLAAGPTNAGRAYSVLATSSGTSPGFFFNGVLVPINPDPLTLASLGSPNNGFFWQFGGTLNAFGNGSAFLNVPPALALPMVGADLNFAFVLVNPFDFVSEPALVAVNP